jgi:hypothetical protein
MRNSFSSSQTFRSISSSLRIMTYLLYKIPYKVKKNQGVHPKTMASKAIRTKTPFLTCLK